MKFWRPSESVPVVKVFIGVTRPCRRQGNSSIAVQDGIIVPVHQNLKLSRDAWLNLLKLRGNFGPDFLLCRLALRAGYELCLAVTVQQLALCILSDSLQRAIYLGILLPLMKTPCDSGPTVVAWTSVRLPSSADHAIAALITFIALPVLPVKLRVKSV